ncbi:MAG: hypothetical protein KJO85_00235 [Gammaproteobacteria bacterium]|nr:hypothetical protein [Gammaproteobacteria bacterium]NNE06059.1 hypothetical protein [Xanthomonadales bacterium]
MAHITRRIGLSLGADICWPICYEALLKQLDLKLNIGNDTVSFDAERVEITPFNLNKPARYDVVIDRLTHWYHTSREWIKQAVVYDDLYVFNNPWSLQSMEKHTTYSAMMRLGFPIPETWMIPPKSYVESPDLKLTLSRYARLFNLGDIGDEIGYPLFMKPYDGGAWVGVTAIKNREALLKAYEESGTRVMHLQAGVIPNDGFVRCVGLGPQWRFVNYDPDAPLHDRYTMETDFLTADEQDTLSKMTMVINAFFGWDFNSCESMRSNGVWHPIDFANACPDSQVTALHYHFPWLIKANLRWSLFCAASDRKMVTNLDWQSYFDIAARDIPFDEKLDAYADIAMKRLESEQFEEFCEQHLPHMDEVANEFFASDTVRDAIHQKVESLFPEHEIESFTELFWQRIQDWRAREGGAQPV